MFKKKSKKPKLSLSHMLLKNKLKRANENLNETLNEKKKTDLISKYFKVIMVVLLITAGGNFLVQYFYTPDLPKVPFYERMSEDFNQIVGDETNDKTNQEDEELIRLEDLGN